MKSIYICNNCGTVSISGNHKCPNCGADEQSGWQRIEIQEHNRAAGSRRLKIYKADFYKACRAYWKPLVALILLAACLSCLLTRTLSISLIALIIISVVAYRLINSSSRLKSRRLYKKLLKKAGGDKTLASRMIESEHRRNPEGNVDEWLQDAIIRWERDLQ